MATYHVTGPGGSVYEVEAPDNASEQDVISYAQRQAAPAAAPSPKPKSLALGLYKGAMKPIDNGARALESGARAMGIDTDAVNQFFHMPSASQSADQHAAAISRSPSRPAPSAEIAGNILGTIPAMMATKNPFIGGAMSGAALTDQNTLGGVAGDALKGGIFGHIGGKLMDKAADAISPYVEPAVRRLSEAGVRLTPGMIKGGKAMTREDKAMSRPQVGERIVADRHQTQSTFNSASLNEAIKPLGFQIPKNLAPGFDQVDAAKKVISHAYDKVIPNIAVTLDGQAFAQKLAPRAANLEPAQRKQLQAFLTEHLKNGQLSGQKLKDAQGEIRRLASNYSRDAAAPNRELGSALHEVDDILSAEMIAQNPAYGPALQKVNTAYRGYRIVADAASRGDDGIFNTGQLKQAVRRGDRTKNKDASARGAAFMQGFSNDARAVIPAKTPNSGTAERQMAGNVFANIKGGAEAIGYRVDDALSQLRLIPRPKAAQKAAGAVKRLKGPAAGGLVAYAQHPRD